jgi:hypothetical protein
MARGALKTRPSRIRCPGSVSSLTLVTRVLSGNARFRIVKTPSVESWCIGNDAHRMLGLLGLCFPGGGVCLLEGKRNALARVPGARTRLSVKPGTSRVPRLSTDFLLKERR